MIMDQVLNNKGETMKKENKHKCSLPDGAKYLNCGPALDNCEEDDDGELYIDNGEYASQVNFCPICGYEAKVKIIKEKV